MVGVPLSVLVGLSAGAAAFAAQHALLPGHWVKPGGVCGVMVR